MSGWIAADSLSQDVAQRTAALAPVSA